MNTAEELDIITRMRGEVMSRKDVTGENLFLAWGYPTVLVLLAEFAALMIWNENWCAWLWAGIPLIGTPLMIYFLNKDYDRTHSRTHDQNNILVMWIFIGVASCIGGGLMGFSGVFCAQYRETHESIPWLFGGRMKKNADISFAKIPFPRGMEKLSMGLRLMFTPGPSSVCTP